MATTGSFKQVCPSCEAPVLIRDASLVGKKVECPKCKYRFAVESPKAAEEPESVEDTPVSKPQPKAAATKKPAAAPAKKPVEETGVKAASEEGPKAAANGPPTKKKAPSRKLAEDDEDEEEEQQARFKKKQKGSGSSNMVLIAGGGLAVVALGLLGVGAFFMFGTGENKNNASNNRNRPTGQQTTKKTETVPEVESLVDVTNLLPNETQDVIVLDTHSLVNSVLGNAAFRSPGAFQKKAVEEALGLKLDEVERVVVAGSEAGNWSFVVIRTTKPINPEAFVTLHQLKDADGSPIKGQKYYTTPPLAWMENFRKAVEGAYPSLKWTTPVAATSQAVRIVDPQTIVVADVEPMKAFLEAGGKPKNLAEEPKPDPAKGGRPGPGRPAGPAPAPAQSTSTHWVTVKAPLRNVLEGIEAKGAGLIMGVFSTENRKTAMPPIPSPTGMAPLFDPTELTAVGISFHLKDRWNVTLGFDAKTQDPARKLVDDLKQNAGKMSQTWGVPIDLDGQKYAAPVTTTPMPTLTLNPLGIYKPRDLKLTTTLSGNTLVLTTDIGVTPELNTLVVQEILQPNLITLRGMLDMQSGKVRIFDLATGAAQAAKQNPLALRGTVSREGAPLGRPYPPDQRVSWMAQMLPQLGHQDVYDGIKFDRSWRPDKESNDNARMGGVLIPEFLDPTSPAASWMVNLPSMPERAYAATNFVGVAGVGYDAADYRTDDPTVANKLGVFGYDRETKLEDVKDGLANTIMIIQVPPTYKRPWIAGGGATVVGIPEKQSAAPFVSGQRDGKKGTYVIMLDGSVRFVSETISDDVFKGMATINGGEKNDFNKDAPLVKKPE